MLKGITYFNHLEGDLFSVGSEVQRVINYDSVKLTVEIEVNGYNGVFVRSVHSQPTELLK